MLKKMLCLALFIFPIYSNAGALVGVKDIEKLLEQKPQIKEFIDKNFDIISGIAQVKFSSDFIHLGGGRMGPYDFIVIPKGNKKAENATATEEPLIVITLCTTHQFLDGKGKVIPEKGDGMFLAAEVNEKVIAVLIREIKTANYAPGCPTTE
jgi:hypothetical protein